MVASHQDLAELEAELLTVLSGLTEAVEKLAHWVHDLEHRVAVPGSHAHQACWPGCQYWRDQSGNENPT